MGDTKSSYNPNKCDGKTGRTGQWIYHRMVEEPEVRCTSENFPANHHEQEQEGEEDHSIPVCGCNGLHSHRIRGSRLCHHRYQYCKHYRGGHYPSIKVQTVTEKFRGCFKKYLCSLLKDSTQTDYTQEQIQKLES